MSRATIAGGVGMYIILFLKNQTNRINEPKVKRRPCLFESKGGCKSMLGIFGRRKAKGFDRCYSDALCIRIAREHLFSSFEWLILGRQVGCVFF